MEYIGIDNKTALNKLKKKIPYEWDLNIYRGCIHGCKYCYALYSHEYLGDGDFFNTIYYKKNIIGTLEKELSSPKWKRQVVNIGSVCDSYQEIERELKIMPEILKLMIKYKTPIIISTKSNLILRDIDLIDELSKITYVNIAFTITTMDENLRKKLEPNASPSMDRFNALKELKKTNASLGVHIMPIIPYLTDNYTNLEKIYKISGEIGVDYVLPGTINLRGKTRGYFLNFLQNYNIDSYNKFLSLYRTSRIKQGYKEGLYKRISEFKKKYNISSSYSKPMKEKMKHSEII